MSHVVMSLMHIVVLYMEKIDLAFNTVLQKWDKLEKEAASGIATHVLEPFLISGLLQI